MFHLVGLSLFVSIISAIFLCACFIWLVCHYLCPLLVLYFCVHVSFGCSVINVLSIISAIFLFACFIWLVYCYLCTLLMLYFCLHVSFGWSIIVCVHY